MKKQMSLGKKLSAGFGVVLAIAVILGLLGIINMLRVGSTAKDMVNEYVPTVAVANNVERWSLKTMYEMRGYAFTEEEKYIQASRENLAKVKEHLRNAKQLAKDQQISELDKAASEAEAKALEYEKLAEETVKVTDELKQGKEAMFIAATTYMKICDEFLKDQEADLREEISKGNTSKEKLLERAQKITLCNSVIDTGNLIRIGTWKAIANRDPKLYTETRELFKNVDKYLDDLRPLTHQEKNIQQINACQKAGNDYAKAMDDFLKDWMRREELGAQRGKAGEAVLQASQQTALFGMKVVDDGARSADSSLSLSSIVMIIGLLIGIVVGIVISIKLTQSITGPINRIISNLNQGSDQTAAASAQVSSSSQSLAEGSSEQAASLEETSSSLEEMASMTHRNSESAGKAKSLANQAKQAADHGCTQMNGMSEAMQEIKNSGSEIAKIIKTIDEIAFQTNILSLNAAVEAARAGEAGMGFAVVADEVRSLAQRAAMAAKETEQKITTAIDKSNRAAEMCENVSQTLREIAIKAAEVDNLAAEVATASQEQSKGVEQVNLAVSQMDKVTQSSAANAEETAAAAEELSAQAETLRETVGELKNIIDGSSDESINRPRLTSSKEFRKLDKPAVARLTNPQIPKENHSLKPLEIPKRSSRPELGKREEIPMGNEFTNIE